MRPEDSAEAFAAGAAAWPACALDRATFDKRAAALAAPTGEVGGAELYLAIAIEAGVAGAVEALEERYIAQLPIALAAHKATPAEIDEVVQQVRAKLVAPRADGTTPLVDYAGRGQLDGLVRVTALRVFLNMREKTAREVSGDNWLDALIAPDLEREVLAAAERADVKHAIAAALAELPARERAVLRMHFVNELGIDPIAKLLGVHRATAARQLSRIKHDVVTRVRKQLAERWGESAVLGRVASQMDLSMERLLASGTR